MFLLAQASDLIYLFLLMFLSEHVFKVSKEIQQGVIFMFILTKISFLYFYINEEKYDTKTFVSLRIFIFSPYLKNSFDFFTKFLTFSSSLSKKVMK